MTASSGDPLNAIVTDAHPDTYRDATAQAPRERLVRSRNASPNTFSTGGGAIASSAGQHRFDRAGIGPQARDVVQQHTGTMGLHTIGAQRHEGA